MAHGQGVETMTLRKLLPLVAIACAAFIFNTSEFMPVGLLTDIAGTFGLSEAQTGMMISIYAWAVMVLSLPLMVLCSRFELKSLMLAMVALFMVGQIASAMAPSFALLIAARLLVAVAHAVFWSIASPMAARIAGDRHASFAMGMVVTGTSVAMIFGMPLGRVVGLAVGWRMTFACVAAAALVVLATMAAVEPRLEQGEPFTLHKLPELLRNRMLVVIYAATVLIATGYYTGYSYIEPFFQQIGGMAPQPITAALMLFGGAGIVGSMMFSRWYDGHRATFERIMVLGVAVALALMTSVTLSPFAAFAVCALWGLSATAFNVAFQAEIIRTTSEDTSAVAMSIYSGLFNLGVGCGSWLGGIVVDGAGIGFVGYAGAVVAFAGFLVCVAFMRPRKARA